MTKAAWGGGSIGRRRAGARAEPPGARKEAPKETVTIYALMVRKTVKGTSWRKGQFVSFFGEHSVGARSPNALMVRMTMEEAVNDLTRAQKYVDPEDLFEVVPFEVTAKKKSKRTSRKVETKRAGR